jgi:gluconolactonase
MKTVFFDRVFDAVSAKLQTPYELVVNDPVVTIAIIGHHTAIRLLAIAKLVVAGGQEVSLGDRDGTANAPLPSRLGEFLRWIAVFFIVIASGTGICSSASAAEEKVTTVVANIGFPEGTIFVKGELYFVDYFRSDVERLVDGRTEIVWHQPGCGANGLVETTDGLIVACFDSGTLVLISLDGKTISVIPHDQSGRPFHSPNDLAIAKNGRIYFSTSGNSENPGKVYLLLPNRTAIEVASDIRFANGVGLSPDGATLYVAETSTGQILAFEIAADGSLGSRRNFIRLRDMIPGAKPDSFRVDDRGNLFVALYDGGGVAIVSAAGKLMSVLRVPADHHTNLALSPDGGTLYVAAVDDSSPVSLPGKIVRLPNPMPH